MNAPVIVGEGQATVRANVERGNNHALKKQSFHL